MLKYLALAVGILYASRAYANKVKKVNIESKKKVLTKEKQLDSIYE